MMCFNFLLTLMHINTLQHFFDIFHAEKSLQKIRDDMQPMYTEVLLNSLS